MYNDNIKVILYIEMKTIGVCAIKVEIITTKALRSPTHLWLTAPGHDHIYFRFVVPKHLSSPCLFLC